MENRTLVLLSSRIWGPSGRREQLELSCSLSSYWCLLPAAVSCIPAERCFQANGSEEFALPLTLG